MTDHDPRLTASIDARLCELALLHMRGDHTWVRTVMSFAADVTEHDEVPELLSSMCRLVTNLAIRAAGDHDAAIAHFTEDLEALRRAASREAQEL